MAKKSTNPEPPAPAPLFAIVAGDERHFFEPGPNGMRFSDGKPMPVEAWRKLVHALSAWAKRGALWTADTLAYGLKHYGEAEVEATLEQASFNLLDAKHAVGIAALGEATRTAAEALGGAHLWVLAKAQLSPEEERKWAERAAEHKLSPSDLGTSIAAGRVVKGKSAQGSGSTATIQGIRQAFEVLKKRWEADAPVEQKPEDFRRALWRELDEQTRFGLRVAQSLGIDLQNQQPTNQHE